MDSAMFAWQLSIDPLQAKLTIPALLTGLNFFVPGKYPLYSFIAVLGIVPDLHYTTNGYKPMGNYDATGYTMAESDWLPVLKRSAPVILETPSIPPPPDEFFSLILSIGIRFGR